MGRLPLRNWKQTRTQARGLVGSVKGAYGNYQGASKKVVKAYKKAKYEYNKSREATQNVVQSVQRYGVQRTVIGQKSIYAPRPSETAKKKVSELKKRFFGGSIYD